MRKKHWYIEICEVIDVLTRWEEFFRNVYMYQIIMVYILNILQFCQLYLDKAEGLKENNTDHKM